jgi:hypothetical protein
MRAAREAGLGIFFVPHRRWEPLQYKGWNTRPPIRSAVSRRRVCDSSIAGSGGPRWFTGFLFSAFLGANVLFQLCLAGSWYAAGKSWRSDCCCSRSVCLSFSTLAHPRGKARTPQYRRLSQPFVLHQLRHRPQPMSTYPLTGYRVSFATLRNWVTLMQLL